MATAPQTSTASPIDGGTTATAQTQTSSGKATAALVLGILGLLLFFIPIAGWVLGGIAIAMAVSGKSEIRQRDMGGMGKAKAGLVLGIIAVVLATGIFVANMAIAL